MRSQILIGTNNDEIRDEELKFSWGLEELRKEGMKMESAVRSGASNLKGNEKDDSKPPHKNASNINCFNCGSKILGSITNYKSNCPAKTEQMVNVRRKAISKRFVVVYQLML